MYKVITNTDKVTEKAFESFKEAIKFLKEELEEWQEYFEIEKKSDVFFKIWHRCEPGSYQRYMYAGCVYLKKF